MKNRFAIPALVLGAFGFAACSGTALAQQERKARCALTYKESVDLKGPCTFLEEPPVATVKGTAEERGNTYKYIAVIDNGKNEGLLIGGGAFTLADGKLAKNEMKEVRWPNGYVLKIEPE